MRGLGEMGPEAAAALPEIKKLLKQKDGLLRVAAAEAIWRIDHADAAVPTLMEILRDDEQHRLDALAALGGIGPPARSSVPALLRIWKEDDESERWYAAQALKRIDPEAAKKAGVR